MRTILLVLICFTFGTAKLEAQTTLPLPDRTVAACLTGVTERTTTLLADSMPIILVLGAYDCSNCRSAATSWGNFATAQQGKIRLWAPMTWLYQGGDPACSNFTAWDASYNWGNIHTFTDTAKYWFNRYNAVGLPRYIVFRPADGAAVYIGNNQSQAQTRAVSIIPTVTAVDPTHVSLSVYPNPIRTGQVLNLPTLEENSQVAIVDLNGRNVAKLTVQNAQVTLPAALTTGLYILRSGTLVKQLQVLGE
jgi:hypothetical protein